MTVRRLFGGSKNPLADMERLVLAGVYKAPRWFEAVRRVPPLVQLTAPHPGRIVFPEDRLYSRLYERLPVLVDEPLYLTDANEPTIGSTIARKWAELIDSKQMDEDIAFKTVMSDAKIEASLKSLVDRIEHVAQLRRENPDSPGLVTFGNIQRVIHEKFRSQSLICDRMTEMGKKMRSPLTRYREEMSSALSLKQAVERDMKLNEESKARLRKFDSTNVVNEVNEPQRASMTLSHGQWVVPDMSIEHNLRFVQPTHVRELNQLYNEERAPNQHQIDPSYWSRKGGELVQDPIDAKTNSFEFVMSQATVNDRATLRDFIAYTLHSQIMLLKNDFLVEWRPYTDVIDRTLWRQARVVLTAKNVGLLHGSDMEGRLSVVADTITEPTTNTSGDNEWQDIATSPADTNLTQQLAKSFENDLPLVRNQADSAYTPQQKVKHLLLLSFIDDAIVRNQHLLTQEQFDQRAEEAKSVKEAQTRAARKAKLEARQRAMLHMTEQQREEEEAADYDEFA